MGRKRKKSPVRISGETTDGKKVMAGLFWYKGTHGLPYEVIFDQVNKNGWMVDWIDFYNDARKEGANHVTIINQLSEAICEVWGKEFRDVVIKRLEHIMK